MAIKVNVTKAGLFAYEGSPSARPRKLAVGVQDIEESLVANVVGSGCGELVVEEAPVVVETPAKKKGSKKKAKKKIATDEGEI